MSSQAQIFRFSPFGGVVLSGEGPPTSALGVEGNLYIDRTNLLLYGPKTSSGWGSGLNLRAPTRLESTLALHGVFLHTTEAPTNPVAGDVCLFNSEGICSWLNNRFVYVNDLTIYDGTSWRYLGCGEGVIKYKGTSLAEASQPINKHPGDLYVFSNSGLNNWGGEDQLVNKGTTALYSTYGWHFNRNTPENLLQYPAVQSIGTSDSHTPPPTSPSEGNSVFLSPGTLHSNWVSNWQGGAFSPSTTKPTLTVYNGTAWVTLEPLLEPASENVAGKLKLASQVEVNLGTNELKAVTPKTLAGYAAPTALAPGQTRLCRVFSNSYSLVANVWTTVLHNLNNPYPGITTYQDNEVILLDMERVDSNSIRIRSAVNLNNVTVTVVG